MGKNSTIAVVFVATLIAAGVCVSVWDSDDNKDLTGQVYILHTNDSHGHYDEEVAFYEIAGYRDYLESKGATVFLLDAGDTFQGSSATMLTKGESSKNVIKSIGYDAMTIGNHEFDYSLETYLSYVDYLGTTVVCSNLYWKDSGDLVLDAYTVVEKGGVRLGIFGLLSPDTYNSVAADLIESFDITDPIAAASESVEILKSMDCDYIVALGHVGLGNNFSVTSDYICSQVEGIDVFIDGHSHSAMSHGRPVDTSVSFIESDTVIASTGGYLSSLGVVTLGSTIDAYLMDSLTYTDAHVKAVMSAQDLALSATLEKYVCHTDVDLEAEYAPARLGESNFADLACDLIREESGADMAVINGGTFRGSVSAGDVTVGDIYTIIPFEDFVQTKILTGQMVLDMMENAVRCLPDAKGRYLQVSGMTVVYDSSKDPGSRIVSITVGTDALDLDATYTVASVDFVLNGNDGFDELATVTVCQSYGVLNEIIIENLSAMGTVTEADILLGRLVDLKS